jgi:hypothetical protein
MRLSRHNLRHMVLKHLVAENRPVRHAGFFMPIAQ